MTMVDLRLLTRLYTKGFHILTVYAEILILLSTLKRKGGRSTCLLAGHSGEIWLIIRREAYFAYLYGILRLGLPDD